MRVPSAVASLDGQERHPFGTGDELDRCRDRTARACAAAPRDLRAVETSAWTSPTGSVTDSRLGDSELGNESALGLVAQQAGAALGLDFDHLRAFELQVAFDAAVERLRLPAVEDALEAGLAVRDLQVDRLGAEATLDRADRLLDRDCRSGPRAAPPTSVAISSTSTSIRDGSALTSRSPILRGKRRILELARRARDRSAYASSSPFVAMLTPSTSMPGITSPAYTIRSSDREEEDREHDPRRRPNAIAPRRSSARRRAFRRIGSAAQGAEISVAGCERASRAEIQRGGAHRWRRLPKLERVPRRRR